MQTVEIIIHANGVNSRFLGMIRSKVTSAYWRLQILFSLVVRRLKRLWTRDVRALFLSSKSVSECMGFTISFMNTVFGCSEESVRFWQDVLLPEVVSYFGQQDDLQDVSDFKAFLFSRQNEQVLGEPLSLRLFSGITRRFGLKGSWDPAHVEMVLLNPSWLLNSHSPFSENDLLSMPFTYKHLPIVSFCKAKVLQLRALLCSGARAWNLNWRSASLFCASLRMLTTIETLRNFASALHCVDERDGAAEFFGLALSLNTRDSKTLYRMANAADISFENDRAEYLYLRSLEASLNPHRLVTFGDFILSCRGDFKGAIEMYEAALHMCPNHAEALSNLAVAKALFKERRSFVSGIF